MLKPAFIFTDHAVLQRDKLIPVFGESDKDLVTVEYLGYKVSAKTRNGKFLCMLPKMEAKLSGELIFSAGDERISFSDVVTGDVFIAGGQSNMEHPTFCTLYDEDDIFENKNIRLFTVPRRPYKDAKIWGWHFEAIFSEDTPWEIFRPESALSFSGVATFFAKKLSRHTDIPIGIISCNWGATNAESWTKRELLMNSEYAKFAVIEYDKRFGSIDMDDYNRRFDDFENKLKNYISNHEDAKTVTEKMGGAYALRHGFNIMIAEGPYHYKTPGNYRMTMLERIIPYSVCGVLWYQGESNSRTDLPFDAKIWFQEVMHIMIKDWRESFLDSMLPFYIVQISTYPRGSAESNDWCNIRDVHEELGNEDNIYTVVSSDIGEVDNIHPIDKKPIGERLALAALANYYGLNVEWESPKIDEITKNNGKYILTFKNAKKLLIKGESARGFFVTDKCGITREISATIQDNKVFIDTDEEIASIGYCNRNFAIANVYNEHMLPLFPFDKDVT